MAKHARLTEADENGDRVAIEVVDFDPDGRFHPDIASQFIQVPDATEPGSVKNGQTWSHPDPVEPEDPAEPQPVYRKQVSPAEFRNSFSAFEEVAINEFASGTPAPDEAPETSTYRKVVGVFFDRVRDPHLSTVNLEDPRNLAGLDLLVTIGLVSQARRDEIARGIAE